MKKLSFMVIMFLVGFFSVMQVNAASLVNNSYCEEALDTDGEPVQICRFVFDVDGTVTYNQNSLSLTLTNVVIKSIQVETGWYYKKVQDNLYAFETSNPTLSGHVEMATIVFEKINEAQECSIHYSCDWSKIDRSCSIFEGNYYGPNGDIITALEYEKQCMRPACKDYGDGTYSDKTGNLVSKVEYEKQCLPHYCEVLDGTYYGKDGTIVTEEVYRKQCEEKPSYTCELVNGIYYGLHGNIVSYMEYLKECEKPVCKDYGDGTYSDKMGNLVPKLEFEKQCLPHFCEILSDGTYYGKNGNVVSEEIYNQECGNTPSYICEVINGIYYGKNGTRISYLQYQKECETHFCEILDDGTHYDANGNIVTAEEYKFSCETEIENPQTGGKGISIFILLFCGMLTILIFLVVRNNKKIYHL